MRTKILPIVCHCTAFITFVGVLVEGVRVFGLGVIPAVGAAWLIAILSALVAGSVLVRVKPELRFCTEEQTVGFGYVHQPVNVVLFTTLMAGAVLLRNMPVWGQIICVIGVVILLTPLIARADDRSRLRYQRRCESWRCPRCGGVFGAQEQFRTWGVKRDPYIRGLPTSGPVLRCPACQVDFAFDELGREVDEQKNYVQRQSRM